MKVTLLRNLLGFVVVSILATASAHYDTDDFLDMDLETLMEVPVVVSGSRQEQKLTESAVPITVVTAEDIHYSGLTEVPEILKFYTGIDFLRIGRDKHALGVRGHHELYSDRLQTLIDGRAADNFFAGGPQFERLPIFVEDIERIEIIRGPGGAAWGANAFTGVINIITKDPCETQGLFASTTWNHFGDSQTHLRWGDRKGKWSWRVSAGYDRYETSDEAVAGDNFTSIDSAEKMKFDVRLNYAASEQTKWLFGVGYAHRIESLQSPNQWFDTVRTFARVEHEFDNGDTGYLQFSSNVYDHRWELRTVGWENDIEGQLNFELDEKHSLSVGGNFRATYITDYDTTDSTSTIGLNGVPDTEFFAGAFIIDRYQVNDRFWLEGQLRGDWYSETQVDWSGRASAFYRLDEKRDGIFRFSAARAFRTPLSALQRYYYRTVPMGGGLYMINVEPDDRLKNEQTWSLEAGYSCKLGENWSVDVDAYYQHYEDLVGFETTSVMGRQTSASVVSGSADSYGTEIELSYQWQRGQISAWYAYNEFDTNEESQSIRTYEPAANKFGMRSRWHFEDGWTLYSALRCNDNSYIYDLGSTVGDGLMFDIAIAKTILGGDGELMFGVSDLFHETREAVSSINSNATVHPTPGRTFWARLQLHF